MANTTKKKTATKATTTASTAHDTRSIELMLAAAKEAQLHSGYLARNMVEAFDGAIDGPHADALNSLVALIGELTTVSETAKILLASPHHHGVR